MLGLSDVHSWFDTRFAQKMASEFPDVAIFYENQPSYAKPGKRHAIATLNNSAADTVSMHLSTGAYMYKVQYEVVFLFPEADNVREQEKMIERFSVWYNEKNFHVVNGVRLDTERVSVANIGNRDQFFARQVRIPARVYIVEGLVT